jgi:hypothetical protein
MRRSWLQRNRLSPLVFHTGAGGLYLLASSEPAASSPIRGTALVVTDRLHPRDLLEREKEKACISLVKLSSGGPGHKTRRAPGCFCRALPNGFPAWDTICAYTGEYPIPLDSMPCRLNVKNPLGNSVRTSRGINVARYTSLLTGSFTTSRSPVQQHPAVCDPPL